MLCSLAKHSSRTIDAGFRACLPACWLAPHLAVLAAVEGSEWQEGEAVAGVMYKSAAGEATAHAHLSIVCDGMYSSLRTKLSEPSIQLPSFFVGLLLQGCNLPWANYGHVVLAKPSPILFYPISSTEVCRILQTSAF